MFDFNRAERPAGWVSEREACSDWFNSTFKEVDADMIESPESDRYLKCRDLPEEGSTISQYSEYGQEERFSFTVNAIDVAREIVIAEDDSGEVLEMPFDELSSLDGRPIWNAMWVIDGEPSYEEIQGFNECGISVYEDDDGDWYFGIDGCGYDFYDAHWIKLYRKYGICWHSTEDTWLDELKRRISSYVEMCADIPKDITWSDRHDLMKDAVETALDPNRIERIARRHLRHQKIRQFFKRIGSLLIPDLPKFKHSRSRYRVSACD